MELEIGRQAKKVFQFLPASVARLAAKCIVPICIVAERCIGNKSAGPATIVAAGWKWAAEGPPEVSIVVGAEGGAQALELPPLAWRVRPPQEACHCRMSLETSD